MQKKLVLFEDVLQEARKLNPKLDRGLLKKAFEFALEKHKTKPDSARMQHVLAVASTIAKMGIYDQAIVCGLLHDLMFREGVEKQEIEKNFGGEIAEIVEECTKVFEIEEKNFDSFSDEILSNVLLGIAKDIRVVFIVLASALDSLERPDIIEEKNRNVFAKRCLGTFVPICDKLGLSQIKWRLEDSAFKVLNPESFQKIKKLVNEKREARETEIEKIAGEIKGLLKNEKITAAVTGRPKHFYSIYKKMDSGKTFEEMKDLLGVRIICENIKQCYELLGIIHSNYEIVPEEFDDYIINPKNNNYKSIHTVIIRQKQPVEIQIRTWEMHWDNETGFSSHWAYKEYEPNKYFDQKLGWGLALVEWLRTKGKTKKFLESFRMSFGEGKVFALTPKNKLIVLPEKSTPVDFAFAVHSDLGFKCQNCAA